jgi:AraC-like DNA-binding protein
MRESTLADGHPIALRQNPVEPPHRTPALPVALVVDLDQLTGPAPEPAEQTAPAMPAFVYEVEQFCRRNFSYPIGVEDMARVARMSRYHFSRKFESARGIPPGRYLASLRLGEATRLLSHGGYSVKEIAAQCGYRDANYFCKVFRRSFGTSPGKLRVANAAVPGRPTLVPDPPAETQQDDVMPLCRRPVSHA